MPDKFTHFFSCDWGTTAFRLRLVDAHSGEHVSETVGGRGVREIASSLPETATAADRGAAFAHELGQALRKLPEAERHLADRAPIVVSGMASSSIGWRELPYAHIPFAVDGSNIVSEWLKLKVNNHALPVLLVSGLASTTEIMRGEETQLIGLLALPEFRALTASCTVVLPGTHSKHIQVKDGCVTALQTHLTGELFQVLRQHSVLRFTTEGEPDRNDEEAFLEGVAAARDRGVLRSLFQTRTRGVLGQKDGPANRNFLSGLLIGGELLELSREPGTAPILIATSSLARSYELAARAAGLGDRLTFATAEQFDAAVTYGHQQLLRRFAIA